jgi:glycosyltransferase 2 family protein
MESGTLLMSAMSEPLEPVPAVPPKTKIKRYLLVLIVLGLGVYFLLPRVSQIQHAFQVAATLRIPFVVLALGAQVCSYLGSGYLLRAVARLVAKPVTVIEGALVTLGANSVGTLGGGLPGTVGMTYRWLRQRGVSAGAAGLGGWIPIFLHDAALAVVSLVGLLVFIFLKKMSGLLVLGMGVAVLILASGMGAILWCLTHREKFGVVVTVVARFISKLRRKPVDHQAIDTMIGRLLEAWDTLLQGGWHAPAVGAVLDTGFDILTLALLFLAAGHGVSPLVLLAGYGMPQLIGKVTMILGGVGVVETTMVALYTVLGVPTAVSVVVVLVYRLFSLWLPTIVGIGVVSYFEHRKAWSIPAA